jgi:four helix bundle protein
MPSQFHAVLKEKVDRFSHEIYRVTKHFPKEEQEGLALQLRRCALSAAIHYLEVFSKKQEGSTKHSLEAAHGALQEAKYLLQFAEKEGFVTGPDSYGVSQLAGEVGAMIWGILKRMNEAKAGHGETKAKTPA